MLLPDRISQPFLVPPAADGPTLVMAFRASVEAEKWARKDEADYAVSLSHRLGFRGELNNGTLCILFGSKPWTPVTVPFSYSRRMAECTGGQAD